MSDWQISPPDAWRAVLAEVQGPRDIEYMVLYHHPRKGWCFKEGLQLSPSSRVLRWTEIEE